MTVATVSQFRNPHSEFRIPLSYRTVKRTLGESNLERKCRWLFGTCLLVLISASFWLYGSETNKIVYDMNRFVGEVLVDQAMFEEHINAFHPEGKEIPELDQWINRSLAEELRDREFRWDVLLPENELGRGAPTDEFEWELMDDWTLMGQKLKSMEDADIEATSQGENKLWAEQPDDGESRYVYYQPVFAKRNCIYCHDNTSTEVARPDLQPGELMAVVRVEMDAEETKKAQARNIALLIVAAIITVFLAMVALYVIVRYVIVKPLRHLRDVSDAVRRGDVEQRAVIHTGDEFEELGAAFNRMLRQLLRQQDELRSVNGELDGKLDELAQANMRLFEMNQLKSDFLATVSHELKTPLNSIIGFSDLLRSVDRLDDKEVRYADNIQRSGHQLLEMITDILDLAKIESGKLEISPSEFNIGTVVATQCDLARPLSAKKNIDLSYEISPGLPTIWQDRGKIEQVLNNLISNAIKFTPDGGRIDVEVSRDSHDDLRLTVVDTGVGISPSEQQLIFEKFRQGTTVMPGGSAMTREYSGTGLGLSIVRELCRLLGGDITVESEVGKGSVFTVHLPWKVAGSTNLDSPLADELKEMTKSRLDLPASTGDG